MKDSFKSLNDDCKGYSDKRAILSEMLAFLEPYSHKAVGSLRSILLYKIMETGVFVDKFDLKVLERYVKRPISNYKDKLVNSI